MKKWVEPEMKVMAVSAEERIAASNMTIKDITVTYDTFPYIRYYVDAYVDVNNMVVGTQLFDPNQFDYFPYEVVSSCLV